MTVGEGSQKTHHSFIIARLSVDSHFAVNFLFGFPFHSFTFIRLAGPEKRSTLQNNTNHFHIYRLVPLEDWANLYFFPSTLPAFFFATKSMTLEVPFHHRSRLTGVLIKNPHSNEVGKVFQIEVEKCNVKYHREKAANEKGERGGHG